MTDPFDAHTLECFLAAAEELNFTRAAGRVFLTQPALSQKIARMEAHLGVPLFVRFPHGVALTPAGEVLADGARQLLADAASLAERVKRAGGLDAGRIRLGYVEYAVQRVLPSVLAGFLQAHRDVAVERVEMPAFEHARALAEYRIDVGIGIRPIHGPGVRVRTIVNGSWTVVVPSGHRLASAPEVRLADLAGERLILFARELNPKIFDRLMRCCRTAGFEPRIVYESVQAHVGAQLVADGVGVLWIASYALPGLPEGVVARTIHGAEFEPKLAVAWRRDDARAPVRDLVRIACGFDGLRAPGEQ